MLSYSSLLIRRLITAKPLHANTGAVSVRSPFTPIRTLIFVPEPPSIPPPTEKVPDVSTFLEKIGHDAIETADHFKSWDQFQKATSQEMKEMGIDTKLRRYILRQRETFRKGLPLHATPVSVKRYGGEYKRKATLARLRREAQKAS